MKIREDLVFDKTTGMITGFVDFGQQSLDERFSALKEQCTRNKLLSERTVATHMLTLMVRGIFFKLNFPFAQFATTGLNHNYGIYHFVKYSYDLIIGVSSNYLIYIVWRAIRLLQIAGLQVICVVADGASANRRFLDFTQLMNTRNQVLLTLHQIFVVPLGIKCTLLLIHHTL